MHKATVADVAREAGVSTATVSRALTGARRVNAKTIVKVKAAATKLGYSGNPIARALRKNATGNIGVMVPTITNPFFTQLVEMVEHRLVNLNLNLYLCTSRDDPDLEAKRLASLCQGSVDAILVSPCDATLSAQAITQAATAVPVVQLDREAYDAGVDWVGLDDHHAMGLAIEHLAKADVRSIALITSDVRTSSGLLRTEAVFSHCQARGIAVPRESVFSGEFTQAWGAEAARRLLATGTLPDAVVCADDQVAIGAIRALITAGARIPDDIRVIGLDDAESASLITPSLTTVRQPVEGIANEAVRLVHHRLSDSQPHSPTRISLRGELIVRQSA